RPHLRPLPQRGSAFVLWFEVTEEVEGEPDLGCEKTRLLLAGRHSAETDVRVCRRQALDDGISTQCGFVALSAEIELVPARRQFVNHGLDVAVVAVVKSSDEDFHRLDLRSPARCVNIRISYTALRLARRLLPASFLAPTSV